VELAIALQQLPELYARALRLKDRGLSEEEIAEQLDIPLETVAPCLRVAELKLARLLETEASVAAID
jgi:DNA-directed RNA polymerase specialized sigma24 family protein